MNRLRKPGSTPVVRALRNCFKVSRINAVPVHAPLLFDVIDVMSGRYLTDPQLVGKAVCTASLRGTEDSVSGHLVYSPSPQPAGFGPLDKIDEPLLDGSPRCLDRPIGVRGTSTAHSLIVGVAKTFSEALV